MESPERMAEIMTATRSLKWCGTTYLSIKNVMQAKITAHTSSQSNSLPIEDCERCTLAFYEAKRTYSVNAARMSEQPRVLASEEIFKGPVFRLRRDTLQDSGRKHRLDIVEHPGSYAIAALPSPDRLVLIRQYRHAAGRALWEIPAGTAEERESCEDGARRELREETGFLADSLELLCAVYPTPGYSTERVSIYAARGLHAGPQQLEDDERIEVREVTFEQARGMQASGEIIDMKTLVALLWLDPGRAAINKFL
jgi:ADP-ribose pyrophosphatase